MRSFWLAVIVIAGVLLLVGLRVEGSKRTAVKKEAAAQAESKSASIVGYGETEAAARREALRLAVDWIEGELREQLKPGWSLPHKIPLPKGRDEDPKESGPLDPVALEKLGVINFEEVKETVPIENVGFKAEHQVTLTQKYVDAITDAARKEHVSQEKTVRKEQSGQRQMLLMRILGGAVVVLLVVAGYLRLEEATHGYYTGLLRAAAIGVVVVAVLALVIIR